MPEPGTSRFPDLPARFDGQGNPMARVGCPNCGAGSGWVTIIEFFGAKNSGRDPAGPCSRACALQIEHAKSLSPRGLR
jgi:hypothetical protein